MSADSFASSVVRVCAAKVCQNMGFSAAQSGSLDLLADVTRLYIERLCKDLHEQSEQSGRTVPVLDDLGQALAKQLISVTELGEYMRQVGPDTLPNKIPMFPVKVQKHKPLFGAVSERELASRPDYIPSYFPPQHPEWLPDGKTKISEHKEPRVEATNKREEQTENANINPAKLSTTARRSTLSEVRRKTKPAANDELPDFGDLDAFQLGLVRLKPTAPKIPKPPPVSIAPSPSAPAFDAAKESMISDRLSTPKVRELVLKRSPSPKTPERSGELNVNNEPKIVLKLGMIPSAKQKEVHVKESKKEKKQLDRSSELEPGEIPSSLDSSIDECITAVIGENIRLNSPTTATPPTPIIATPPERILEVKQPAVVKAESVSSIDEPSSADLFVLKSKLKKNREKGTTIEGIRKKLEKKRAAEAEKNDQAKVISEIVSKNFTPIVSKKAHHTHGIHHSKTKQLPSTSQLPSLPPLSLRVPSSKPLDVPSSKVSEPQPSKKADIPKPVDTVRLFAPDAQQSSTKLTKSPLKLHSHKADRDKHKLSVSPLKIHVHKPHKEKKKESHGKDAPFPKFTLSIGKKKASPSPSSSLGEKPAQPTLPSASAAPAAAASLPAATVAEKVPAVSVSIAPLPAQQSLSAHDQAAKHQLNVIQDDLKKKKKQKRDKEKHHHHRKDKERHHEKKEKEQDTSSRHSSGSSPSRQAPHKGLKRKADEDVPDSAPVVKMPKLKLTIKLPTPGTPSGASEPKQSAPPVPLTAPAAPAPPPPAPLAASVCQPLKLKIPPLRIQRDNLSPASVDASAIAVVLPPSSSSQASPPPKTPSPSRCGSGMDDYDFAPPSRGGTAQSDDSKIGALPPSASPKVSSGPSTPLPSPTPSSSAVSGAGDDQVWICPVCSVAYVDGASDMIGCDTCNNWYHWSCVGLLVAPPDDQPWFCNSCARHKGSKFSIKKVAAAVGRGRRKSSGPGKRGGGAPRGGKKK